jgi:hypothetical protein
MKQNKYFSTRRFVRLFRNDLMINQKTYLFGIVGLSLAIYSIAFIFMNNNKNFSEGIYSLLFTLFLMAIGVFVGTAFPALKNQIKTSNYLLAPGSTLEKCLVQFVIRMVIFIPIALLIFWISVHLAKASLVPNLANGFDPATAITDFHFKNLFIQIDPGQETQMLIISLFSGSTILFAGSAFFNRFALVKTLIAAALVVGLVILSFVLFSHIFYPDQVHGFNVHLNYYIVDGDRLNNHTFLGYIIGGLSWLFFLPLAYFKLKEKEV